MNLTGRMLRTEYANLLNEVRDNILNESFEKMYESHLEEAKKPEWSDDILELYITRDRNGNKVLKVVLPSLRFNIQTNGNLPKTHSGGVGDYTVDELVKHVKSYGSTMQKNAISRYVRMTESTELEEGVSSFDRDKIITAVKKGKKVTITHKSMKAWKNIDLGLTKDDKPYVHDFQGSEDIAWDDIKSFKIESTELEEADKWFPPSLALDTLLRDKNKKAKYFKTVDDIKKQWDKKEQSKLKFLEVTKGQYKFVIVVSPLGKELERYQLVPKLGWTKLNLDPVTLSNLKKESTELEEATNHKKRLLNYVNKADSQRITSIYNALFGKFAKDDTKVLRKKITDWINKADDKTLAKVKTESTELEEASLGQFPTATPTAVSDLSNDRHWKKYFKKISPYNITQIKPIRIKELSSNPPYGWPTGFSAKWAGWMNDSTSIKDGEWQIVDKNGTPNKKGEYVMYTGIKSESTELEEATATFKKGDKVLVKNTKPNGTLKYDSFGGKFIHGIVKGQSMGSYGAKIDIERHGDLLGNPPQKTYQGSVGSMTVDPEDVILDTSGKSSLKLRKLLSLLGEDIELEEGINVNHSVLDQLEKIANDLEKKDFVVTTEDGNETEMTNELAKSIILSYQAIKKEEVKRAVQKLLNQTQAGLNTYIEKIMNNVDVQSILKTRYMSGPGADNGTAA